MVTLVMVTAVRASCWVVGRLSEHSVTANKMLTISQLAQSLYYAESMPVLSQAIQRGDTD